MRQPPDPNEVCLLPYVCHAVGLPEGSRMVEVLERIRRIKDELARMERYRRTVLH
jgi:hypothetical protein